MKTLLLAFAALFILSSSAFAQTSAPAAVSFNSAGPWQGDAIVGIQSKSATNYAPLAAYESGAHKGQPIALMAVGGAAIILGAIMDNDAGPILMVGGSVLGLYGLYLYLR